MAEGDRGRVIVLGLDGLDWAVVDTLLASGQLPALGRVLGEGRGAVMATTIPPLTPAAWSTLFSGLAPAEHGVFDFTVRERGSYRFRLGAAADREAEMVWSLASAAGREVVVLNVPMTWPATPVNGIMVSGMDAPGLEGAVFPAEAMAEVLAACPGYTVDAMSHWFDDREVFAHRLEAMHRARHRLALDLLRRRRPDLFIAVYVLADRVQHVAWTEPPGEAVAEAYRTLDRAVADYLELLADGDSLLVLSDHGFQGLRAQVGLNRLLEEAGLLVLDGDRCRALLERHNRRLAHTRSGSGALFDSWWSLPPRALWFDGVHWPRTRCVAFGLMGSLMVNVAGREPQGAVRPGAEVAAVIDEATQVVGEALRRRLGEVPVVAHPVAWDERRPRPVAPPDAVLELDGYRLATWGGREFFAPDLLHASAEGHTGVHSAEAVLMTMGRGFPARAGRGAVDALDVTPTILDLLGLGQPAPLPGRSLAEV